MLGGDDHQCFGAGLFDFLTLPLEMREELVALCRILDHVCTAGDTGRVTQDAGVDETHRCFSSSVNGMPPPVIMASTARERSGEPDAV